MDGHLGYERDQKSNSLNSLSEQKIISMYSHILLSIKSLNKLEISMVLKLVKISFLMLLIKYYLILWNGKIDL